MKSKIIIPVLALCCFLLLSAFSQQSGAKAGQPTDERQAQDALPKSHDPMWAQLGKTKIKFDEKTGQFSATYPPEVKALVGKQITIQGFMLPLEATDSFKHFILSKRTPTCPFCPPGEPNEILDVWMDSNVSWSDDTIKVSGTFELMNNPDLGMFFKLSHAQKSK